MKFSAILCTLFLFCAACPVGARAQSRLNPVPREEVARLEERLREHPNDRKALRRLIEATSIDNPEQELRYARRLKAAADSTGDEGDELFAALHIASASLFTNRYDSVAHYLDRALAMARRRDDRWALAFACNAYGIYTVDVEMDHYKAIAYFVEGLRHAEESAAQDIYPQLLGNLSVTYFLRNDPAGLEYAEHLYRLGTEQQDPFMIFAGAYVSAAMHYLLEDYPTALGYMEQVVGFSEEYFDRTGVHTLYANILHALGRDREAAAQYRIAREGIERAEATSQIDFFLGYGRFLIATGRDREAIPVLEQGIASARRNNNTVNRHKLYEQLSLAHKHLGDTARALACYERFHREAIAIFNVERERSIGELRIAYQSEKKEKEIREQQLTILRAERRQEVIVFIMALVLLTLGGVWLLYRRKNKLYLQIVRQHREAVRREQRLQEQLAERKNPSPLPEGKGRQLFRRLEELMQDAHLYRRIDLNADRLAEAAASNRTYVSRAVNECAGTDITGYINSYRINEAIAILSDPRDDTPLKALACRVGFGSLRTFYKLFNEAVGMPPSKFRQKSAEIAHEKPA